MFSKTFKVDLVTKDNQRITVYLQGEDIREIVAQLKGNRLTFIPRTKENRHTFTLYTHTLGRIQYEVLADSMYGQQFLIYDVIAD